MTSEKSIILWFPILNSSQMEDLEAFKRRLRKDGYKWTDLSENPDNRKIKIIFDPVEDRNIKKWGILAFFAAAWVLTKRKPKN